MLDSSEGDLVTRRVFRRGLRGRILGFEVDFSRMSERGSLGGGDLEAGRKRDRRVGGGVVLMSVYISEAESIRSGKMCLSVVILAACDVSKLAC
jgi:hypothetical protein